MIALLLLALFLVFVLTDTVQGLRRGCYPSLVRLLSVVCVILLAFFTAEYIGDHIMELELVYEGERYTLEELLLMYAKQMNLEEALDYSETVKQLVMHMPEVLVKELLFIPLFFIYKLVTLPIIALINHIFFPRYKKDRDGSRIKTKKRRFFGMLVGAVQGVLCFAVVMVPVFGLLDFGTAFSDAFEQSESEELVEASVSVREGFITPLESASWVQTLELCGMRTACTFTFEKLSKTELTLEDEHRTIYYFETLEEAFPAINAFVVLKDIDPSHMTSEDYQKLGYVFDTAKSSEEVSAVLTEVTSSLVSQFVDEHYKGSADAITDIFLSEVLAEGTDTANVDYEKELGAVQTILEVIDCATDENADHAFDNRDIDVVIDTVLTSDVTYTTLIKATQDEKAAATLREEISMSETMKEKSVELLDAYREGQLETATPEEMARILEATDAIAGILGVTLTALPTV